MVLEVNIFSRRGADPTVSPLYSAQFKYLDCNEFSVPPNLSYVFGNPASGKSTLLRLLDGHPELAVSPIQEHLIGAFTEYEPEAEIVDELNDEIPNILELRSKLANTGYYKFEANQVGSPRTGVASTRENQDRRESLSGFDFYQFERRWVSKAAEGERHTPENIISKIFNSLFEEWEEYNTTYRDCKYVVGFGDRFEKNLRYFVENIPNSKAIVVQRDPRGIAAAEGVLNSHKNINEYISSGSIFDIVAYNNLVSKLVSKHNNNNERSIKVVDFEDLILDTNKTIGEICKFLHIEEENILKRPTLAGKDLKDTHVGEINDSWQNVLSSSHRNIIEVQMGIKSPSSCSLRERAVYEKSKIMYYGSKSPALRYIYTNYVAPRLSRFKRLKPAQNR